MSKEQTPPTVEELVIKLAELYTDLGNAKKPDQGMKLVSTITKEIEQYAQAKVLEREKDLKNMLFRAYCKPFTNDENKIEQGMVIALLERFDKYYETEVRPKYEG